jgi:hypothetical protein
MLVRLLTGPRAGAVADLPLPNARVLLADGRAALPDSDRAERVAMMPSAPAGLSEIDDSPVSTRVDRVASGVKQRRRR